MALGVSGNLRPGVCFSRGNAPKKHRVVGTCHCGSGSCYQGCTCLQPAKHVYSPEVMNALNSRGGALWERLLKDAHEQRGGAAQPPVPVGSPASLARSRRNAARRGSSDVLRSTSVPVCAAKLMSRGGVERPGRWYSAAEETEAGFSTSASKFSGIEKPNGRPSSAASDASTCEGDVSRQASTSSSAAASECDGSSQNSAPSTPDRRHRRRPSLAIDLAACDALPPIRRSRGNP